MNPLLQLAERDQAIWIDFIERRMLEEGELARLVEDDGVRGVTSNPAIFEQAITSGDAYDTQIAELLAGNPQMPVGELYEELAVEDIRGAADVLRPVWEETRGADGFVSLEVSPHLAADTDATIEEARRLWRRVNRPNLMIKVPATPEGIPAVEELLAAGINVNITLMFSLQHYEAVARAYLGGLGRSSRPQQVASVASFFVSRLDSLLDPRLREHPTPEGRALAGKVAIANSKLTYARFREIFHGEGFARWRERGCRPQRVLWASTSTKDPEYRDVLYVEELIGRETVNTMPPHTLEAFRERGQVRPSLTEDVEGARQTIESLSSLGIDLDEATETLQREGIRKFVEPFDRLLAALEEKRDALREQAAAGS
ncbi:MAG: transaldolase [Thermoanaerobaculia bacterium]